MDDNKKDNTCDPKWEDEFSEIPSLIHPEAALVMLIKRRDKKISELKYRLAIALEGLACMSAYIPTGFNSDDTYMISSKFNEFARDILANVQGIQKLQGGAI